MTDFSAIDSAATCEWVDRYLEAIGGQAEAPSLDALGRLMQRQITSIPFENITSILRRSAYRDEPVPAPDPDELLETWRRRAGGGVCYELSAMFERLLQALGYQSRLVLGQISIPGGHQAIVVELDGGDYLVDVGSGSPLFEPIPLDGITEVRRAGLGFRFRPGDEPTIWAQDRWIDQQWALHCRYDLRPISTALRSSAYQHHHTPGASWVTDLPRIVGCDDTNVYRLIGTEFTHFSSEQKRSEHVPDAEAFERLAIEPFGLPNLPVAEAFRAQDDLTATVRGG